MPTVFDRRNLSARLRRLLCVPGLLLLPACAMPGVLRTASDHVYSEQSPSELNQMTVEASYPDDAAQHPGTVRVGDAGTVAAEDSSSADEQLQVQHADRRTAADGVVRLTAAESRPRYTPTAAVLPAGDSRETAHGTFHPAEPRVAEPLHPVDGISPEVLAIGLVEAYPEEYIFDGGDRGSPVRYDGGTLIGLETEDTVVEYTRHDGENRVRPSNRVAVYAPRFGSIRTIAGPQIDIKADKAAGATDVAGVGNLHISRGLAANIETTEILGLESRRRADGVETEVIPHASEQAAAALLNSKVDVGLEGRSYTAANTLHMNLSAEIQEQLQNAIIWTRETFPQVSAATSQATEVTATFKVQETVGIEDQRQDGPLRIIKLADREMAQTGDVITFKIHYQNLSDFEVYNVRITDNLTPRLQFVPDSAQADRPGETIAEPNGEGSQRLIFDFDEPLPPHASGTIIFSTRVL